VENLESKIDVSKIPFLIQLQPVKSLFAALQACSALQMIAYYSSLARGLNPDQQVFDAIDFNHACQCASVDRYVIILQSDEYLGF